MPTTATPLDQQPPPTHYSYSQLEGLWIAAGGPANVAPIMAAIALAESNGNAAENNVNDSNGRGGTQTSWGLWQISNGTHDPPVPNINSPIVNAGAAVAKYKASGFGPWGTYTSGKYSSLVQSGVTPASSDTIPGYDAVPTSFNGDKSLVTAWGGQDAGGVGTTGYGILPIAPIPLPGDTIDVPANIKKATVGWADALGTLLSDLINPSWWKRIGVGVLGVVLFFVGLGIFFASTKTGQKAVTDAETVAPLVAA